MTSGVHEGASDGSIRVSCNADLDLIRQLDLRAQLLIHHLWRALPPLMRLGGREGGTATVLPEPGPDAPGRAPRVDRHGGEVYVYRRAGQPCLVCDRLVSVQDFEARHLFWCGRCQRRR